MLGLVYASSRRAGAGWFEEAVGVTGCGAAVFATTVVWAGVDSVSERRRLWAGGAEYV